MRMRYFLFIIYFLISLSTQEKCFGQPVVENVLRKVKSKVKVIKPDVSMDQENSQSKEKISSMIPGKSAHVVLESGAVIFTTREYKDYAAAQSHAVSEIKDGDTIWMYVKFPKPLSGYITDNTRSETDRETGIETYGIMVGIGPADASEMWDATEFKYTKKELDLITELKINLAPGVANKKQAVQSLLRVISKGRAGKWNNAAMVYFDYEKYIAVGPLTCNVADGFAKYKKMNDGWWDIYSKAFVADNRAPERKAFNDASVKALCMQKIKAKGFNPTDFYFSYNDWGQGTSTDGSKFRYLESVFLYKRDGGCYYAICSVKQPYSVFTARYGDPIVTVEDGVEILCK